MRTVRVVDVMSSPVGTVAVVLLVLASHPGIAEARIGECRHHNINEKDQKHGKFI